ncbi:MAG: substrate-binding domain-containing protein, partial [Ruminococcus sp.]|nr:substrate-binding domain-containing protein [Ruminococcus sp.]
DDKVKNYIDNLLKRSGKPVMLLDSPEHRIFESTAIDDCSAFEKITDHLIEVHGCNKIYCLTGPKKLFVSEERLEGFKNSMKKHGLYYDRSCCIYGDFWKDAAKKLAECIISGKLAKPDAIVCGNDFSAISLIETLINGGICVPDDIAVTGYDATTEAQNFSPSVTTFKRPNFQLGAESFRRLYRIITGKICTKIRNDNGCLCIGKSCGCFEQLYYTRSSERRNMINNQYKTDILNRDMLFDITNTDNPTDFASRLDNYTYYIYKMRHIEICLTEKYIESSCMDISEKPDFKCGDKVRTVMRKSSVKMECISNNYFSSSEILNVFNESRPYPVAYYISPLHYNENFFGYSALSFGKNPMSFSEIYVYWVNCVNMALEQIRIKSALNHVIYNTNHAMLIDGNTGLLNKNGMERAFSDVTKKLIGRNIPVYFIRIQITGLNKIYYHSGEDKCRRITSIFADFLIECIKEDEICGLWVLDTFCIVTLAENRIREIYSFLSEKAEKSQFSGKENCNIDFIVGVHSQVIDSETVLESAIHKSAVNRIFSYKISESSKNPQFERLCMLRGKIMKNPEFAWNISEIANELYLSKSYLQKIYKSYFGKSIIEEMIQFRIDKAKELLEKTDMTVTDVAKECGYSSYNYFVRQFKTSEGISPTDFRQESK